VESTADEKTKLGHELGHCMTGAFYHAGSTAGDRRQQENRAEKWEIRKLITEEALREAVAAGKTEVWELAEHFEVSRETLVRKIAEFREAGCTLFDRKAE
jgi:Zn-dependent peptidase ImmA (M78 family)